MVSPTLISNLAAHRRVEVHEMVMTQEHPHVAVVHDHASIMIVLSGHGTFWMNALYHLSEGDVMLVPAGMPHYMIEAMELSVIGVSLCISCAEFQARDVLRALFATVQQGGAAKRTLVEPEGMGLQRIMLMLKQELSAQAFGNNMTVDALLTLMSVSLVRAVEHIGESRAQGTEHLVGEALAYIEQHALSGISLVDVAQHVGRSAPHVATVVRAATGLTVVTWITRARMAACRQLLLHTEESVEMIAQRCRFASASQFYRVFKQTHGMTPRQWRKAHC